MDVSPAVEAILGIRKELEEFRRTSSKQALRAAMRAACEEALLRQAPDLSFVTDHLEWQRLVRATADSVETGSKAFQNLGARKPNFSEGTRLALRLRFSVDEFV
jgi:hypothetical protein